ncbi:MAG: ABC-2 family transporter protein [Bacilli bacterium]|nr:ABC-2 family transporter protein [Bacilli bacterium]
MGLYFKFMKIHFKSELQYKLSFALSFISQFIVFFGYYFTIICLFDKFSNIKGFTMYEVLLTFSIIQFGFSFCETFFRGIDTFDDLIINGTFDRLLLRPQNILLQVFVNEVSFVKASRLIQSIIILIISIINLDVIWEFDKIITLIFMLFASVILFLSIFILAASYCFFTVKGLEVRNVFTDGGKHMAQYPIGIFKKGFVFVFTYIIPYGFVNYYPLLYLLSKENNKIFIISPLITIVYLIPSVIIFYKGMKRYSSVGS